MTMMKMMIFLTLNLIMMNGKSFFYGDSYKDIDSEKDKIKDSKIQFLIDEIESPESNVLPPQLLTSDSTLPEESFESIEVSTLLSSPFGNKDKCDVRRLASSFLVFRGLCFMSKIARIMKTLVLVVLSIIHSSFNP
ncbi:hypothetical protein Tco_0921745 [Tanacetum coccineum]